MLLSNAPCPNPLFYPAIKDSQALSLFAFGYSKQVGFLIRWEVDGKRRYAALVTGP